MNPAVDVIVDRDDDIATVKAIHSLAVHQRGVLVIHIAPATREEPAVVWAILRALGKRIERLDRPNLRVFWMDAERWLTAHRVREIVVLCAQHLGESVTEELKAHVSGHRRIALALIYSGRAAAKRAATTTLDAYLGKPRDPPQPDGRPRHWPQVPRSDPLRFRYDCWRQLAPKDFARVEGLLSRSMTPLSGRRASTELAGALTVVLAADDGEQAYVRRCGAELALAVNQVAIPKSLPPARYPQSPDPRHVETILSHTSPWTACYELAKLVTGLSDELLALIGGDQVTDDAILGCAVPEAARPILRAVNDGREPVLQVPYGSWPAWNTDDVANAQTTAPADQEYASALGWLLRGRSSRILSCKLSREIRSRFEALRADGILDRRLGVYRASHIALYSSFRTADTADPSTDKRLGRCTDKKRESR